MQRNAPIDEKTNPLERVGVGGVIGQRTLVVVGARGLEERSLATKGTITIGRDASCNIQIDDRFVSKRHASLVVADQIWLVDEGSSNGTFVNGVRLPPNQKQVVVATDVIHIGGAALLFRDATPPTSVRNPQRLVIDPGMLQLYDLVRTVAPSRVNVLLLGETGVGKEVLASAIHESSPRAHGPFVRINCASLPATLVEAELFGYERGAFTGANAAKVGLLEAAHGGTLFLDEIGEASLDTQAKLLRFLETGELLRVGAVQPRFCDVRVVAATNRDLPAMVSRGEFRSDFYFRLNGITLRIPSLRERRCEILPLAEEFAVQAAARIKGWPAVSFTHATRERLAHHDWPGNIRELKATIERAVLLSPTTTIDAPSLHIERLPERMPTQQTMVPAPMQTMPNLGNAETLKRPRTDRVDTGRFDVPDDDEDEITGSPDRDAILRALQDTAGNQSRAAELLGISRRTLLKRLDKYDVPRPRKKTGP